MNIMVMYWGRKGGGPRFAYETSKALIDAEGVTVTTSYSASAEIARVFQQLPVYRFVPRTFESFRELVWGLLRLPVTAIHLARFTKKHQVQVIYLTMESPLPLLILGVVKRISGAKVLVGIHDGIVHNGDRKWLHMLQRRRAFTTADGLMAYSEQVRTQIESGSTRHPRIWRSIHGPFASPEESTLRRLPTDRRLVVGFFGRILPYKGIDILLDAFGIVQTEHADISLRIVGEGDLAPYQAQIASTRSVEVKNCWVSEDALPSIVAEFDLLALPYREASQSGVVGLALGNGVPVVVTPVGGLEEQIRETGGGIVAAEISSAAFAQSIRELIGNPERYESLSASGLAASRGVHSWARAAGDVVTACEELLGLGVLENRRDV